MSGVDCVISEVGPNVSLLWGKRLGLVEAMPSGVAGEAAEASDYGVGGLVRDCRAYTRVELDEVHLVPLVDEKLRQGEGHGPVLDEGGELEDGCRSSVFLVG